MRRRPSDLILAAIIAGLIVTIILAMPNRPILRVISALPLVLILPGYALTAAFFPARSLDIPEYVLFSLGLSLAVTAVAGLALHMLGLSLQANTWAITLTAITVVACLIGMWRRRRPVAATPARVPVRPGLREALFFGLAIVVIGAALYLTRLPTPPTNVSGYTQLWLIPASDGNPSSLRVGVDSKEFATTSYRLQVTVNGRVVNEWPDLQLAPGGSWQFPIELQANQPAFTLVEAALYRLDDPTTVYRQVRLHMENKTP